MDEEINQERPNIAEMPPITQQPMTYYNPNTAPPIQGNLPPVHHQVQPPHVMPPQPTPLINGSVHPEELNVIPGNESILTMNNIKWPHSGQQLVPSAQGQGLGAPLAGLPQQPPMSNAIPLEEPQPAQPTIDETASTEPGPNENTYADIPPQVETEQPDIISETRKYFSFYI